MTFPSRQNIDVDDREVKCVTIYSSRIYLEIEKFLKTEILNQKKNWNIYKICKSLSESISENKTCLKFFSVTH
jgi:hypothetical protein